MPDRMKRALDDLHDAEIMLKRAAKEADAKKRENQIATTLGFLSGVRAQLEAMEGPKA
ncbi:MAG: hypothetical protein ACKVS5_02675 [Parvularculaceae bacterium]